MRSYKKAIEDAYGIPFKEIEPLLNFECFVFVSSMKEKFPDYDFSKAKNEFSDRGERLRPHSLNGIRNNKWEPTNYHTINDNVKRKFYNFQNGTYYHIGFLNDDGSFSYQGVHKFRDGFIEDGYHIKPFPTHVIPVEHPNSNPIFYYY